MNPTPGGRGVDVDDFKGDSEVNCRLFLMHAGWSCVSAPLSVFPLSLCLFLLL